MAEQSPNDDNVAASDNSQCNILSTFEKLPTEIVEQIAVNLTYSITVAGGSQSYPNALGDFRLTSKTLESRIHRPWLRTHCSSRTFEFSDPGFADLETVVTHPEWSKALRTLRLKSGNAGSSGKRASNHREKPTEMMKEFERRCHALEYDGSGTRMLVDALNRLPNLHTIEAEPDNRRITNDARPHRTPSYTRTLFKNVLDAVIHSNVELKALVVPLLECNLFYGALESNFDLSPADMQRLPSLESISVMCHRDTLFKKNSRGCLSKFLQGLPALKKLHLGLDTVRLRTSRLTEFSRITHPASVLQEAHLNGVYISASEQVTFLASHKDSLRFISLANCSLSGPRDSWSRIFLHLSTFAQLRHAEFRQLVHGEGDDDLRVCFPTTASVIEFDLDPNDLSRWHEKDWTTNPEAWVILSITNKYHVIGNEYENVPTRLQELAEDVEITNESAMSPGVFGSWFG